MHPASWPNGSALARRVEPGRLGTEAGRGARTSELERLRTVAATAQSAIARIETEQDKREKEREIRIAAIRSKIAKLEGDRQTFGAGFRRAQQDVANRQILAPIAGRIGEAPVLLPGSV